jgi:hypothetical protein
MHIVVQLEACQRAGVVQVGQHAGGNVFREEAVGRDVKVAMLAGMREAAVLFIEHRLVPADVPPAPDGGKGSVKVYEQVRLR